MLRSPSVSISQQKFQFYPFPPTFWQPFADLPIDDWKNVRVTFLNGITALFKKIGAESFFVGSGFRLLKSRIKIRPQHWTSAVNMMCPTSYLKPSTIFQKKTGLKTIFSSSDITAGIVKKGAESFLSARLQASEIDSTPGVLHTYLKPSTIFVKRLV